MITGLLSQWPDQMRRVALPKAVAHEAKRRVLDTLGCFYGAYNAKPVRLLRETMAPRVKGECLLWGTSSDIPAELAAWLNGTSVRALDYNDTYLSKEPCHPSDLISSVWAACELAGAKNQGALLIKGIALGYEVLCRLCDAASIRVKGWDHVTYLPIASAVACSFVLGLNKDQTAHAISLALTGNIAMRQTRVGTISDWKASCAAYAARAGLWAARLAQRGFTGPSDIFSGRHGFFNQVSGPFKWPQRAPGDSWMILSTHIKYFPAEHHAQSAIEAAVELRRQISEFVSKWIKNIKVECFDVGVSIIGSEKEKWFPTTRETADHSMPYLVAAALLDGTVSLSQFEKKRFLDKDVRRLMRLIEVTSSKRYSSMYPKFMPTRLSVKLKNGVLLTKEILRPKGYAGRPMTDQEVERKFEMLASPLLPRGQREALIERVARLEKVRMLKALSKVMQVRNA